MSLQLCPAPLFLSSTPFCGPSTCTHLDRTSSSVLTDQLSTTTAPSMDSTGAVPFRLELDGAALVAADSNTSAGPSPAILSASIVTTASPYSTVAPSASSMQILSSDAALGRESKRPRIISRHFSTIAGAETDMGDRPGHHTMNRSHDPLDVNYSQDMEMGSQSRYVKTVLATIIWCGQNQEPHEYSGYERCSFHCATKSTNIIASVLPWQ